MAKKITTTRTRKPDAPLALLLSLCSTGLGELYCGHPARGITLFLARLVIILAFPLYSAAHPAKGALNIFIAAAAATLFFTLISPLQAVSMAKTGGKRQLRPYNRTWLYIFYGLTTTALTLAALALFMLYFPLVESPDESSPVLRRGDILLVLPGRVPRTGDLVMIAGQERRTSRVVALEGETVTYDGITLRVAGGVPRQGIFSLSELHAQGLSPGANVLSQVNGGVRHAIVPPGEGEKPSSIHTYRPGPDRVAILSDSRGKSTNVEIVSLADITGRIDGIVRSPSRGRWLLRTSLPLK